MNWFTRFRYWLASLIPVDLSTIRKPLAFAIGAILAWGSRHVGWDLTGYEQPVIDFSLAVVIPAFLGWLVPNRQTGTQVLTALQDPATKQEVAVEVVRTGDVGVMDRHAADVAVATQDVLTPAPVGPPMRLGP